MALVDIVALGLTVLTLPWAIIELGLSAYVVSVYNNLDEYYIIGDVVKSRADFLVFASLWTILVAVLLLVFPLVFGKGGATSGWAAPFTIAINAITMIFWLAGFAAWADLVGTFPGVLAAALAFAIMLWLIFLALTLLSILTAFNVLSSDRFGYGSVSRKSTVPQGHT